MSKVRPDLRSRRGYQTAGRRLRVAQVHLVRRHSKIGDGILRAGDAGESRCGTAQEWTEQAEIFIVMGSSLQVQPAASFPVIAKRNSALLAIINREPGPLDEIADFVHHGAIGEFCARFGEMIADG